MTNNNICYSGTYLVAGVAVQIKTIHRHLHNIFADYLTRQKPELFVTTSEEEIAAERLDLKNECSGDANDSDRHIEILLIYRKLAHKLLDRDILLMHASCIIVGGEAMLFVSSKGNGMCQLPKKLCNTSEDGVKMVSDDITFVSVRKELPPTAYIRLKDDKLYPPINNAIPFKSIVYLQPGKYNEINKVSFVELFPKLLQQSYLNEDPAVKLKVADFFADMAKNTYFYELHCNMNIDAAEFLVLLYSCIQN